MPPGRHPARPGTVLLLALLLVYPFLMVVDAMLFRSSTRPGWGALAGGLGPASPPPPQPPAVYRWLPPDTRTVLTLRPQLLLDSPLASRLQLDKVRNSVFSGFRLGNVETVVVGIPDQEDLERAFIVVEGKFDADVLEQRLREGNPSLGRSAEGSVNVLELELPKERQFGVSLGGSWHFAPLDGRTCLICLGDRKTLAASLNPKKPPLPAELAGALAERDPKEQAALVMLPPFMKSLRKKMDFNPLLQAFPHLQNEAYDPPSDMEASLTGCLRVSASLTLTDRVDGELRAVSEREADAEKFRKNLEYSLNLVRKASRQQVEGMPAMDAVAAAMDDFFRSLEVVSEGKKTVLRRKAAR